MVSTLRFTSKRADFGVTFYPGSLLTLTRALVELLEVALLLGSLLLIRRGRPGSATLLLSFAILAKETALLVAVAALLLYVVGYWMGWKERISLKIGPSCAPSLNFP